MSGLRDAWEHESAFRQECALATVLIPLACWVGRSALEMLVLIAPMLLVLIVELLNSGLEALVDRVGPEHHLLSGRAKDMGSAAVFVALSLLALCWGVVLLQHARGAAL